MDPSLLIHITAYIDALRPVPIIPYLHASVPAIFTVNLDASRSLHVTAYMGTCLTAILMLT
jgi:hypothetical protein